MAKRSSHRLGRAASQPPWGRSDCPGAGGNAHVHPDGMVALDRGVAEETNAVLAEAVRTGDRDRDGRIGSDEPTIAIELVEVDDRGNEAPEGPSAIERMREHGKPSDDRAASLNEIDRSHEHDVAAVARAQPRFVLARTGAIVEPHRGLVSSQRMNKRDDQIRGAGDIFTWESARTRFAPTSANVDLVMSGWLEISAARPRTSWTSPLMSPSSLARIRLAWESTSARARSSASWPFWWSNTAPQIKIATAAIAAGIFVGRRIFSLMMRCRATSTSYRNTAAPGRNSRCQLLRCHFKLEDLPIREQLYMKYLRSK